MTVVDVPRLARDLDVQVGDRVLAGIHAGPRPFHGRGPVRVLHLADVEEVPSARDVGVRCKGSTLCGKTGRLVSAPGDRPVCGNCQRVLDRRSR